MSYDFMRPSPLEFEPAERRAIKLIEEKDKKIEELEGRLQGKDKEQDLKICQMIRDKVMEPQAAAEDIEHLTAALVNMNKIMMADELMKKVNC